VDIHHVPVLGHTAVAQLVNVDALDGVALASWWKAKEVAYVCASCGPQDGDLVTLGDQKLQRG